MKYIKSFESSNNISEEEYKFRATILHKLAGLMSNIRGSSKILSEIVLPDEILQMKKSPESGLTISKIIEILNRDSKSITDILNEMKNQIN